MKWCGGPGLRASRCHLGPLDPARLVISPVERITPRLRPLAREGDHLCGKCASTRRAHLSLGRELLGSSAGQMMVNPLGETTASVREHVCRLGLSRARMR